MNERSAAMIGRPCFRGSSSTAGVRRIQHMSAGKDTVTASSNSRGSSCGASGYSSREKGGAGVALRVTVRFVGVYGPIRDYDPDELIKWASELNKVDLTAFEDDVQQGVWKFDARDVQGHAGSVKTMLARSDKGMLNRFKQQVLSISQDVLVPEPEIFLLARVADEMGTCIDQVVTPDQISSWVGLCHGVTLVHKAFDRAHGYLFAVAQSGGTIDITSVVNDGVKSDIRGVSIEIFFEQLDQTLFDEPLDQTPFDRLDNPGIAERGCTVTCIQIFHDGENCPIDDLDFMCDSDGVRSRPKARTEQPRPIQFGVLREKLLRRVVAYVEGDEVAEDKDIHKISVCWKFVMTRMKQSRWSPSLLVQRDMVAAGVNFVESGGDSGAVDHELRDLLGATARHWGRRDRVEKAGVVIVLLCGDSDFTGEIENLHLAGVEVYVFCSKNAPSKAVLKDLVRPGTLVDERAPMVEASPIVEGIGIVKIAIVKPMVRFLRLFVHELKDLNTSLSNDDTKPACFRARVIDDALVLQYRHLEGDVSPLRDFCSDDWDREKAQARAMAEDFLKGIELEKLYVQGITGEQLRDDELLGSMQTMKSVAVHIPGLARGAARLVTHRDRPPLKDTEIYVLSELSESKIKERCENKYNIFLFGVRHVGCCAIAVIDLKVHSTNLPDAKKKLASLCSGPVKFSLRPFISKASHDVKLHMGHSKESTTDAMLPVILVGRASNKQSINELKTYIISLEVVKEVVPLIPEISRQGFRLTGEDSKAVQILWQQAWPAVTTKLNSLGVRHKMEANKNVARLTGGKRNVESAKEWLLKTQDAIRVCPLKEGCSQPSQQWDSSKATFLKSLTSGFESALFPGTGVGASYSIGNEGVVSVAFFQSTSSVDVEEEVYVALKISKDWDNFCQSYVERSWCQPCELNDAANARLWHPNFTSQLQSNFNLTLEPWWQSFWLHIAGKKDDVNAATNWLTEMCKPEPSSSFDFEAPKALTWLLRHPKNVGQRNKLEKALSSLCGSACQVRFLDKGSILFSILGPEVTTKRAEDERPQLLTSLESDLKVSVRDVGASEVHFLKETDEGKAILRRCAYSNGVWWELHADASIVLARCRLPNGFVVEVRYGDAVKGAKWGSDGVALVNSANEKLLSGEVSGIAGDIKKEGGKPLVDACNQILAASPNGEVGVTEVVRTPAHGLEKAGYSHVLHAVPPRYSQRQVAVQHMEATVAEILETSGRLNVSSVVMPILGAGIFGWGQNRRELFRAILKALARFGSKFESDSLVVKQLVIMDKHKSHLQELVQSMLNFDDLEEGHGSTRFSIPPRPTLRLPLTPKHLWEWQGDRAWVSYDYDQSLQLDAALANGQACLPRLLGDCCGNPSDSKQITEGETFATYRVDFGMAGSDHCAMQVNNKSGFPRKVRKTSIGNEDHAKSIVPLFREACDRAMQDNLIASDEWDAMYERQAQQTEQDVLISTSTFPRVFTMEATFDVEATSDANRLSLFAFKQANASSALTSISQAIAEAKNKELLKVSLDDGEELEEVLADLRETLSQGGLFCASVYAANASDFWLEALGKYNLMVAKDRCNTWENQRLRSRNECLATQGRIQYPADGWFKWDVSGLDDTTAVLQEVDASSDEYSNVVQLMRHETGLGTATNVWMRAITKVERVVNIPLWNRYYLFCAGLKEDSRRNSSANELWMKHGTGQTDSSEVCLGEAGMGKNYSRELGNMFGKAIYTAENASYLENGRYCYVLPDGITSQMILCRFAAGNIETRVYDETTRDIKHPSPTYDSIRGNVTPHCEPHNAIMAYRDYQVYPAYLVSFAYCVVTC